MIYHISYHMQGKDENSYLQHNDCQRKVNG